MLKKIMKKRLQKIFPENSIRLWLLLMALLSGSLGGCSYLGAKTESSTAAETKRMTLTGAKNSRDLVSVMKTHDRVEDYVLTKALDEEKPPASDGEIARVATRYWSGLDTLDMDVMKFSSSDKANKFVDEEESRQKSKGINAVRGKKPNGDPTLLYRDGDKTVSFVTCRKDFCYTFSQKIGSDALTNLLGMTTFFKNYDEKYLASNN